MKLREMISKLRIPQRLEIRDLEGWELMTLNSDSAAIGPYMECEITEWFAGAAPHKICDFTVYIKTEE